MSDITVLYPEAGNAFYQGLASRLVEALKELEGSRSTCGRPYGELPVGDEARGRLADVALLVNPREWLATSKGRPLPDLTWARRRILVLAEAVETKWFASQFDLGIRFDGVLDIGFVSQAKKRRVRHVPYTFVFNGPTARERKIVESTVVSAETRPIPWAVIGHATSDRAALADELLRHCDPSGVVFLPPLRPVRPGEGLLSPADVQQILAVTRFYVWRSHHTFPYFESFRFIDAVLAGAVPCKIGAHSMEFDGVPLIFESVEEFAEITKDDPKACYDLAREFFLSADSLSRQLDVALGAFS
jgi:hypothetical protein